MITFNVFRKNRATWKCLAFPINAYSNQLSTWIDRSIYSWIKNNKFNSENVFGPNNPAANVRSREISYISLIIYREFA